MGYDTILYEPGPVARVILNRPHKKNAQSWRLLAEMEDAFNAAVADPDCRIIILSGAGDSFSAGHDLDSEDQRQDQREMRVRDPFGSSQQLADIYVESHLRWRNLPKPTMAMVHGFCIYGGWMIASAMDFIFAADDALFIPTYGDYFTTSWDVGPRKAKEVLFENKFMSADDALQWGFVNRLYPAQSLERETLKYAGRVADQNPFNLRTVKFMINQTMDTMGFSTSVRQVDLGFLNRGAPAPEEYADQLARAKAYLREDGIEPPD